MSDMPESPSSPAVGHGQQSRSTKFQIIVPAPPERLPDGAQMFSAGDDNFKERLAIVIREQERLRYRLSEEAWRSQQLQSQHAEAQSRAVAEINDNLAQLLAEHNKLRDQLAEQVQLNHDLELRRRDELAEQMRLNHQHERQRIEDRIEHERLSFERLAVAAEERNRLHALLAEQSQNTEAFERQCATQQERVVALTREIDALQASLLAARREASDGKVALAMAEAESARLFALVEQREEAATTSQERLREAHEALDQAARQTPILNIRARELDRRNAVERQVAQTSAAAGKPGIISRHIMRRSLKLAREALQRQDWSAAEPVLSMVSPQVDTASAWVQLGHARRELELYSSAAAAYERAAELAPQNGELFVWLGLCRERNGEAELARTAYSRALDQAPALASRYAELNHLERLDDR